MSVLSMLTTMPTPLCPTQHLITVARTKQTARKVTGDHAPRVNLQVLHSSVSCVGMVGRCESMEEMKEPHVKFKCVTCHWQKTKGEPQPYFVATHPTALFHLHLDTLESGHSQVSMLHSFLKAYFPEGGYHFSQLPFNLATPKSMDIYQQAASKLADTLSPYSRILLFLTTHSDEDRGGLFAGYNITNEPVAFKVFEFLQLLLKPLSQIITSADMLFYVCGSIVTKEKSFKGLKKAAQLLLDNTIIQNYPVSSAAQVALHDCGMLGRHSNIILILWESKGLVVQKFIWTDKHIKPWGNHLPVQCPQCKTIQKWAERSAGKTISYECQYPDCGKNMGPKGESNPPMTYTYLFHT
ncbi:hypothetical protein EDC04DRAFT_2613650 [Pisolithus marmoratus]|nr:hypothetical protein EDC04DRAFT_2613650 [Pisolithus marmoratus]